MLTIFDFFITVHIFKVGKRYFPSKKTVLSRQLEVEELAAPQGGTGSSKASIRQLFVCT